MRKKFITVAGLLLMCVGLNAQEQQEQNEQTLKPFYFGIGWSNMQATGDFWGTLDFGFLLYRNEAKRFNIRNAIMFDGGSLKYDGNDYGIYSLSDKIIFESLSPNKLFRYYSFLQGGIGVYGDKDKALFEMPLAYNFGVGVGLDIFIEKNTSIFFEETVMYNILGNTFSRKGFNPKFQIGMRYFF